MRPKPEQPARHFWKSGSRQCMLYVIAGTFEVRLLDGTEVRAVAVCRDGRHAHDTARRWKTHPPSGSRTQCPRCSGADIRPSGHAPGLAYLCCHTCHEVWRIPERRGPERVLAEAAFRRRSTRAPDALDQPSPRRRRS